MSGAVQKKHLHYIRKGCECQMCSVCLQDPCDPRCPNAEPERPALTCDSCGRTIYEGDDFYRDVDGDDLCEDCFNSWCRDHRRTAEVES